jgi:hypothetical protein
MKHLNFEDTEGLEEVLFVLDQGWNSLISLCAMNGLTVLLPNVQMGGDLLMKSIIRSGKSRIATSPGIWQLLEHIFSNDPLFSRHFEVMFIKQDEG